MSFLALIRQAFTIPEGYQDEAGFHFGKPPLGHPQYLPPQDELVGNLTEQARLLSLRASTPACRNSAAVAGVGLFPSVHSSELPRGH